MATSGTNTFIVTRDQIIQEALEQLGVYDPSVTIPPDDITSCATTLNIMCKAMVQQGLPLWAVEEITVAMIANQASYSIGSSSSQDRPLRILDAFIRDSSGYDTSLSVISRYEYDTQGDKSSGGVPNQLMYDPQLTDGIITVFGVPVDGTETIHLVIQRQFQDFNTATDNPDFPQEAYLMLAFGLADLVGLKYRANPQVRSEIAQKAAMFKQEFFAWQQEQVPIQLVPSQELIMGSTTVLGG